MTLRLTTYSFMLIMVLASLSAEANLIPSTDGKTVYDTDLNITWLADASYAITSGFDTDGRMAWTQAVPWIDSLNTSGYLGVTNWRMPKGDPACGANLNCTNSEMGHLFYVELGGIAGGRISNSTDPDLGLFSNIVEGVYWTETVVTGVPDGHYDFNFSSGWQDGRLDSAGSNIWLVADGNVAAVPIMPSIWLFGTGLLGLVGITRGKNKG